MNESYVLPEKNVEKNDGVVKYKIFWQISIARSLGASPLWLQGYYALPSGNTRTLFDMPTTRS